MGFGRPWFHGLFQAITLAAFFDSRGTPLRDRFSRGSRPSSSKEIITTLSHGNSVVGAYQRRHCGAEAQTKATRLYCSRRINWRIHLMCCYVRTRLVTTCPASSIPVPHCAEWRGAQLRCPLAVVISLSLLPAVFRGQGTTTKQRWRLEVQIYQKEESKERSPRSTQCKLGFSSPVVLNQRKADAERGPAHQARQFTAQSWTSAPTLAPPPQNPPCKVRHTDRLCILSFLA